jgi:uncharacterized lipoprotein YddW (UPF0748 family)
MRIILNTKKGTSLYFTLLVILFSTNLVAQPKYETRGVWIATLKAIDWPQKVGENSVKQEKDLINMIDKLDKLHINTVIFQVRPAADAFYSSSFEPWSEWITGKQGKAPAGFFDPLQTVITECHKRGMQVHAWLNPYRLVSNIQRSDIAVNHISKTNPEWTVSYGNDLFANPGIPEVREYIGKVVSDIVSRYDVDGIHMDDYFYPYPIKGELFNDSIAFQQYGGHYYPSDLPAWRRENVNKTIQIIHNSIKSIKPYVQFGIAPFGIWRNLTDDPQGSATRGLANYDQLYADVLYWMKNNWVDYISPQIYWPIENKNASFKVLVEWWAANNCNTTLYSGHAFYMASADAQNELWRNANEIPSQVALTRSKKEFKGVFFYNTSSVLANNLGVNDSLSNNLFKYKSFPALPPSFKGVIPKVPQQLNSQKEGKELFLFWQDEVKNAEPKAFYYAIYMKEGTNVSNIVQVQNLLAVTNQQIWNIPRKRFVLFPKKYTIAVTSLNRFYQESEATQNIIVKLKLRN